MHSWNAFLTFSLIYDFYFPTGKSTAFLPLVAHYNWCIIHQVWLAFAIRSRRNTNTVLTFCISYIDGHLGDYTLAQGALCLSDTFSPYCPRIGTDGGAGCLSIAPLEPTPTELCGQMRTEWFWSRTHIVLPSTTRRTGIKDLRGRVNRECKINLYFQLPPVAE